MAITFSNLRLQVSGHLHKPRSGYQIGSRKKWKNSFFDQLIVGTSPKPHSRVPPFIEKLPLERNAVTRGVDTSEPPKENLFGEGLTSSGRISKKR